MCDSLFQLTFDSVARQKPTKTYHKVLEVQIRCLVT